VSNIPSLSQAELSFSQGIISTVFLCAFIFFAFNTFPTSSNQKTQTISENVVKYGYKQCPNAAEFKQNGIKP
jgi:hypothetical protein